MAKVHKFEESLKRGKKGETEFHALFEDVLERESGFIVDFVIKATGEGVELKTDNWDPTKTENFFMERYSYGDKPGGAHQALEKGAKYFVYFFPMANLVYIWETKALVKLLDKITADQYVINVRNTSHNTRGFKVRRDLLEPACIDIEVAFGLKKGAKNAG